MLSVIPVSNINLLLNINLTVKHYQTKTHMPYNKNTLLMYGFLLQYWQWLNTFTSCVLTKDVIPEVTSKSTAIVLGVLFSKQNLTHLVAILIIYLPCFTRRQCS